MSFFKVKVQAKTLYSHLLRNQGPCLVSGKMRRVEEPDKTEPVAGSVKSCGSNSMKTE